MTDHDTKTAEHAADEQLAARVNELLAVAARRHPDMHRALLHLAALVEGIGGGFHGDTRGADYISLPDGWTPVAVDGAVEEAARWEVDVNEFALGILARARLPFHEVAAVRTSLEGAQQRAVLLGTEIARFRHDVHTHAAVTGDADDFYVVGTRKTAEHLAVEAQLAALWGRLDEAGGRGVDLADRVDQLVWDLYQHRLLALLAALDDLDDSPSHVLSFTLAVGGQAYRRFRWNDGSFVEELQEDTLDYRDGQLAAIEALEVTGADLLADAIAEAGAAGTIVTDDSTCTHPTCTGRASEYAGAVALCPTHYLDAAAAVAAGTAADPDAWLAAERAKAGQ